MSRLDELKKQYPELNMTVFDLFRRIDTTKSYKYMPLLCKILGARFNVKKQFVGLESEKEIAISQFSSQLKDKGVNLEGLTQNELYAVYSMLDFFTSSHVTTITEFIEQMENGNIDNKDVTSYSTINDLAGALTLASIKELTKELEGQVIKEYEDETWLIIRPLTFAASSKYGAATRWCTTYKKEKNYFERYWRQGILVYFINKKSGYKFAGYKGLEDRELSFWDAADSRVDYLELEIDDYLFSIVRKIFKSTDTNKNLCSPEIQQQVYNECVTPYGDKLIAVQVEMVEAQEDIPSIEEIYRPTVEEERMADEIAQDYDNLRGRLIRAAREYNEVVENEAQIRRMDASAVMEEGPQQRG